MLLTSAPADDDPDTATAGCCRCSPRSGRDADDESRDDTCPSCQQKDGIRFLGSAIATLLSVTLSTLFGDQALDPREKKALVFTDSVQDAAHRAGFVESRSHTLTLRAVLRQAVGDQPVRSTRWSTRPSPGGRRPVPALPDHPAGSGRAGRVRAVLAADARPRGPHGCGRGSAGGCCSTPRSSSACSPGSAGPSSRPAAPWPRSTPASRRRSPASPAPWSTATDVQDTLDGELAALRDEQLVAWVRGVLEHMRVQGAIEHEWFQKFIRHDGNRYFIWGGRPRGQGMPAFPRGRSAPAFPRIGPAAQVKDPLLDSGQQPAVLVRPVDCARARRHRRPRRAAGPAAA